MPYVIGTHFREARDQRVESSVDLRKSLNSESHQNRCHLGRTTSSRSSIVKIVAVEEDGGAGVPDCSGNRAATRRRRATDQGALTAPSRRCKPQNVRERLPSPRKLTERRAAVANRRMRWLPGKRPCTGGQPSALVLPRRRYRFCVTA